jgi:hypothetical protein
VKNTLGQQRAKKRHITAPLPLKHHVAKGKTEVIAYVSENSSAYKSPVLCH